MPPRNSARSIGATSDDGPSWGSRLGVTGSLGGACVTSSDASGSDLILTDTPPAQNKIVIDDLIVSTDTTMRLDIMEENTRRLLVRGYIPANGGFIQLTPRDHLKTSVAGNRIILRASVSGNIAISCLYHYEMS